jgi:hypothetical protein
MLVNFIRKRVIFTHLCVDSTRNLLLCYSTKIVNVSIGCSIGSKKDGVEISVLKSLEKSKILSKIY